MRVSIVSRIFDPEVSATSGLLRTWAEEFRDRGCEVTVVTTRPPRGMVARAIDGVRVRRAAVHRDRQQYVRGYVSYLSFDIPLVFRLLFSRRASLYVVEPPPTTVAVARIVGALRRTPYVVDAADLWSDAAAMATSSRFVLTSLRIVEKWGLNGASHLFAAHQPLIDRFREIGITTPATPIGFGADTASFRYTEPSTPEPPLFVYAGTHSEWHGAGIFVDAFASVVARHSDARLLFVGNGKDREALKARADELGISNAVSFQAPVSPAELSPILSRATVSLASLKPLQGYDYAFTTKIYSSLAAGCPVIFTGVGPTVPFLRHATNPDVGVAVEYEVAEVVEAMEAAISDSPSPEARARLSAWASDQFALTTIAREVVGNCLTVSRRE